ncbi:hypothetical protein [Streptomyces sp. GS7]|uniref:hypothetical protein n=1 Tax=Streptomyces sp. GS7 TaxID=2692234 RepID=UPI003FA71571
MKLLDQEPNFLLSEAHEVPSPQREQHQQQPAPQHLPGQGFPGRDRGELASEAGDELGLLEDVDQVERPPTPLDLGLQGDQVLRLLLLAQRGDLDPRLAVLAGDLHPARGAQLQRGVEPGQSLPELLLQGVDELTRVQRLADRPVVHVPAVLEVRRQVVLRVAPAARAGHPDLPEPQSVPQRDERAQLVRDALHPAFVVHHRRPPMLGHHPVQRDALGLVEVRPVLDRLVQVPLEQGDRVHHRPVGGVVALQLQHRQQRREHPPPVVGVRRRQHCTDTRLVPGLVRRRLRRQRLQRLLADHRKDDLADRTARLGQRRLRDPQHHPLLAADLLQLLDELAFDLLLRPRVDLLHQLNEQVHQRIGDLRLPHVAQRRQQRVPH